MYRLSKLLISALLTLGISPLSAQENLIFSDEFDNGVTGWTVTGQPGGTITWSQSIGLPPGSLLLATENAEPTNIGYRASSECYAAQSDDQYSIEVDSLAQFGDGFGICHPVVSYFSSSDCSGTPSGVGNVPVHPNGEWTHSKTTFTLPPSSSSVRVDLLVAITSAAPNGAACHFDNVQFYEGAELAPSPVPSGGLIALLIMIGGIVMISFLKRTI